MDTILAYKCTLLNTRYFHKGMATRQNSSSGKPKSPRIQVVLPEELCKKLSTLAELESRTVSNMAKVLIQEGINNHKKSNHTNTTVSAAIDNTEQFISALENQESKRLKGVPKRLKFLRK